MIVQVRPADLTAWFSQVAPGSTPLVLDVREQWELAQARLTDQGFELLAIPMAGLPARLAELDPGRPIACLCHHGVRSQHVAAYLEHHGHNCVANIVGGIDAWAREFDSGVPRY